VICPVCEFVLDSHTDLQAAKCYAKFLHKLKLLDDERNAPLRLIYGGRGFRRDSVT
jgi:hypothetical protein